VTFASFNNPAKLSAPTLAAWAEILRRVPDATLTLKYQGLFADPAVAARVRQALGGNGVDPARLRLVADAMSREDHLAAVGSTDIVLDPFPYNGNTSTIEALWMGVPVVALRGARFIGRMGAAILERVGLDDLAADSPSGYADAAVTLAADAARRRDLRTTLRDRLRASTLFDPAGQARAIETALIDLASRPRTPPPG
jgi:protein O-GlcNAc transferase